MSQLDAVLIEMRRVARQDRPRLGLAGVVLLLMLATAAAAAELHSLPTWSAGDFNAILFAMG